jgi:hypothetical protein
LFSFCQDENTGVVILTNGESNNTNQQIEDVLYQYAEDSIITTSTVEVDSELNTIKVDLSPNPCKDVVRLRYLIHDIGYLISDLYGFDGRMIYRVVEGEKIPGEHEVKINVSDLPPGIYFVRMQIGKKITLSKLVKME